MRFSVWAPLAEWSDALVLADAWRHQETVGSPGAATLLGESAVVLGPAR